MLNAVKTKLSNYLSPIFERNRTEDRISSIELGRRKRPLSQVIDSVDVTPGKRTRTETINIRSPLKLFDGFRWGGIFDRIYKENINLLDMKQAESAVKNNSPLFSEVSEDVQISSRKILTASRRGETRIPLSQISNATILDLTDLNEDDERDDPEITNISIDLTKPSKSSILHPKKVDKDTTSSKVAIDLTNTKHKSYNRQSIFDPLPVSNMIGPLNRQKSAGFLHETVRLDEKTRYKSLLAHYTSIHLPEYSESISPGKPINKTSNNDDSVTTLSSTSWFSKKYVDPKPIFVDLTDDTPQPLSLQGLATPRRKFFHELLSKSKSMPQLLRSSSIDSSSMSASNNTTLLKNTTSLLQTPTTSDDTRDNSHISSLLDTDWIQKWRETIDPIKLERERRIAEEEKRKEAIKRKQKEEFEELQKKIQESAKVSEFIELTNDMKSLIKRALGPGNARDILVEGFNAEITRADIATLRKATWLNDEVVNFYFNLLKERSEKDESLPKVHVFNTFFYPKIMKVGHSGVKRWTRKIDVFSFDLILIPVHLGMHWCLAVVDLKAKQVAYYDSLRGNNPQCIVAIKKYLDDESKDKKKTPFNFEGWTEIMPKDIPQQMNGCDCGVFACKYAEYRSRSAKFTFKQENMPYFRKRMVYEICNKKLL